MFRFREQNYFVYITTNPAKTVLYTGVTNDLNIRIQQHKANKGLDKGFAAKYYCFKLVYYERFPDVNDSCTYSNFSTAITQVPFRMTNRRKRD